MHLNFHVDVEKWEGKKVGVRRPHSLLVSGHQAARKHFYCVLHEYSEVN